MDSAKHLSANGRGEHSFRILEARESYRLEALYCALGAPARRRRFYAAVSDASIRSHCESLSRKGALVLGAFQSNRMDAAIEVVPFSPLWEAAEIAVTTFHRNSGRLIQELLRLAVQEAQQRGCESLVSVLDDEDPALLPLLASHGELEFDEGLARIDISDSSDAECKTVVQRRHSLTVHPRYRVAQMPLANP
jgi:hypothetical protein